MHKTSHHYHALRKKWTQKHAELKSKVWEKHRQALSTFAENLPGKNHLTAGGMSALMLLTAPQLPGALPAPKPLAQQIQPVKQIDRKAVLLVELAGVVPSQVRPLSTQEEQQIAEILTETYGMKVSAELDGKRLNRSYGLIGGEQHLYRYPGDTLAKHAINPEDRAMYLPSGIAPGLGAWRYFANSEKEMTQLDIDRERYYIAVQTFLAPGFNENVAEYKEWFKYRKMLVVNPKTGQAVVADIADAGPGQSTGKHLGGSPEVMHFVGLAKGPRKGAVLYYFIDDPENKVPLGPVAI